MTEPTDELVKRLRSGRWLGETTGSKAADRIEAQAARIAELEAQLARAAFWLDGCDSTLGDELRTALNRSKTDDAG